MIINQSISYHLDLAKTKNSTWSLRCDWSRSGLARRWNFWGQSVHDIDMMPNTTPNQVTMPEKWQVPRYLPLKKKNFNRRIPWIYLNNDTDLVLCPIINGHVISLNSCDALKK